MKVTTDRRSIWKKTPPVTFLTAVPISSDFSDRQISPRYHQPNQPIGRQAKSIRQKSIPTGDSLIYVFQRSKM
jgi:hypothetical protein